MFVNWGPFIPECKPEYMIKLTLGQEKVFELNPIQSLLFIRYLEYTKQNKIDLVFKENFWKSLLPQTKEIPSSVRFSKSKTNPITARSDEKHKRVYNKKWFDLIHYKAELPNIFMGRSLHPLRGTCKYGITSKDVTINLFNEKEHKVPGVVRYVNKPNVNWSASWTDPLTQKEKYVLLVKESNHVNKFDQARRLKRNIKKIRMSNSLNIQSTIKNKQLALACHFIEKLGIRVGNEKYEDESDTIGCCTLEKQNHVNIVDVAKRSIRIDFNGKDGIPFTCSTVLEPSFFNALVFLLKHSSSKLLFNEINPQMLNRYLHNIIPGLSAKVFRTYRASNEFQKTLFKHNDLLRSNAKAAEVCNHKRCVNKVFIPNLITSRLNYIDPRIYYAYIKRNPSQAKKLWFENCEWAQNVDANFKF